MSYQQARRLRGQSLSSIYADELIQGQGYLAGAKGAIGLKTKATIKGLKEKFDPLNIAKALTGGSRLGPALLGKYTGRSRKDIEYFAGRARPIGSQTATKIGKDPHAGGDQTGMSEVLNKILELQQRTYDNIKEQREKKNNFQEERNLEAQKRHNELIKALTGVGPGKKEPTAEKISNSGGLDFMSIINSMLDAFGGLKNILKLGTFFIGPVGLAILGAASLAALAYTIWKNSDPEAVKEAMKGEGAAGVGAAGLGAEGQTATPTIDEESRKKLASAFDKKGLSGASLEELQAKKAEILDVGVDPRIKEKKGMTLDVDKKRIKQITDIDAAIAKKQTTAAPTGSTTATPTGSESPAAPTAAPAATTPPSQQLNAVTSENNTAKMDSMATTPTTTVNNVTANKNNPKPKTPKDDIPPVRNMEATFQRMIYNSTRVV